MQNNTRHLYLFTLEVAPLDVGGIYNPLPSHLTLVSRFWSEYSPEIIADIVVPRFRRTKSIELVFEEPAVIGPKHTAVHLIEYTDEMKHIHDGLLNVLKTISVEYTHPQFVGSGHKPHVSRRKGDGFVPSYRQMANAAYLIEVIIEGHEQLRFVRAKFALGQ